MENRSSRLSRVLLCLAAALLAPTAAAQYERILDYHSDVTVRGDGSMQVTETIRVGSAQRQIRHGIYRDFPTRYTDHLGNRYVVGFEMLAATRDGAREEFRVEDRSNGKRIYLGSSAYTLPPGEHTFTLIYATSRQLGFFSDHDELFWNVTGNGWGFAIEHASATVRLPPNIPAGEVRQDGFTGPQGSMAHELAYSAQPDGSFNFVASHTLAAGQGLTILLMWPKGYVVAPTAEQKFASFLDDNRELLAAGGGLLVIFAYYLAVWFMMGRDPSPGAIMALYEPPDGFSPAAMRFLARMGYDNKTFACAVLNMAVKGFLQIKEHAGSYTLYRGKADYRVLSSEEKVAAQKLFEGRTEIWLNNVNHTAISAAIKALTAWLKTAEEKIYFLTNARYMLPAVILSLVMLVAMVSTHGTGPMAAAGFMGVWLTIWSVGVWTLLTAVARAWRGGGSSGLTLNGSPVVGRSGTVVLTLFVLPFAGGEVMGIFMLAKATSLLLVMALLLTLLVHLVFHYLLKAPTGAGRQVLDRIEGFKMFLGAVEGDHLNRVMPPEQTPAAFEKFLPYALALDVEQAWAQKFAGVLDGAAQASASASGAYSPSWYAGSNWSSFGATGFASSLSSSFSDAISASASAPGSGGGGGGGGSGGGGGGGGGGGW